MKYSHIRAIIHVGEVGKVGDCVAVAFGTVKMEYGVMLAPMAGITDRAFRTVCKEHGAEYMVGEMISAKALWYHDKKTPALAYLSAFEQPTGVQLFGDTPEVMAYAAGLVSNGIGNTEALPAAIDINMGCPVPKVVNNGEGSALMKNPVLAGKIIEAVRNATTLPVTVKIRTGFTAETKNCTEIAHIAAESGVDMICVHGRTRSQLYAPPVDLDSIAAVRSIVPREIPVIGNGDLNAAADVLHMMQYTGCDGVALARGVCGNPWLIEEAIAALADRSYQKPNIGERLETARRHVGLLVKTKGDVLGILEARKHLGWYTRGMPASAAVRRKINAAETFDEMLAILNEIPADCE